MAAAKPPAASREVVVAVHECLETLKTDKNAHNLGRAAKLLVKLAYLKTPNRFHIAKQNEVIELLVKYLSHDKEFLVVLCAQALMIIAHENEACKTYITKAGAVQPLCVLLKDGSDAKAKAMAARCICSLSEHHEANRKLFRDCCTDLKELLSQDGVDDRSRYAAAACLRRLDKHLAKGQLNEIIGMKKKSAPPLGNRPRGPAVTRRGDTRAPVRRR